MFTDFPPDVLRFNVGFRQTTLRCYDSDPDNRDRNIVVLLHGSGGTAAGSFWALLPMLARRCRVVTFDFIDPPDQGGAASFYQEQVKAVINEVSGGRRVDLLGYSFGAVIAAQTAARLPEQIKTLTLVAGWAKTDAQQLLRNDVWRELYKDGHPALGKFAVFTTYGQYFLNTRTPVEMEALLHANSLGDSRAAKMDFNRTVDITAELDMIGAPTLVVGCEFDQTAPLRHSHVLFGGIERARLFEVKCGHGIVHERPAELAVAVGDFVAEPEKFAPGSVLPNEHA
jgi:pimeloyl-ACP methyl ester carboxylesterase